EVRQGGARATRCLVFRAVARCASRERARGPGAGLARRSALRHRVPDRRRRGLEGENRRLLSRGYASAHRLPGRGRRELEQSGGGCLSAVSAVARRAPALRAAGLHRVEVTLSPEETAAVRLSLRVAFWAVAASLPFGIAVAVILGRGRFWGKTLLE